MKLATIWLVSIRLALDTALLGLLALTFVACGGSSEETRGDIASHVGDSDAGSLLDAHSMDGLQSDALTTSVDLSAEDSHPLSDVPTTIDTASAPDIPASRDISGAPDGWVGNAPCQPCSYASIRGRVCAPDQQTFVSGAEIWVDAIGCDGAPVRIETTSNAAGIYLLEEVPCGQQHIHIRRGSYEHDFTITVRGGELNDITGADYKLCFSPDAARIAVLTGDWDNIEELIRRLGLHADIYELYGGWDDDWTTGEAVDLLSDLDHLQEYDILLIDCGEAHYDVAGSTPAVDANIRSFVEEGGSLYMSDFAYIYSERVWPNAIDYYGDDSQGTMGSSNGPIVMHSADLDGYILDRDMKAYLGNPTSIPISLGLSPLVSVVGAASTTTMHVVAQIPQFDNQNQPLILSFRPTPTSGFVVYTTFHNTEQDMAAMQKILSYLMFML